MLGVCSGSAPPLKKISNSAPVKEVETILTRRPGDFAQIFNGARVLRVRAALRRLQALIPAQDVRDQWRIGAVLDLVAVPESGRNYNAWYGYGAGDQEEADLAALTAGEVRALEGLIARTGLAASERFALALARDAGLDAWLAGALDDPGFIAQNVYLYCASAGLASVLRGSVDRESLTSLLGLKADRPPFCTRAGGNDPKQTFRVSEVTFAPPKKRTWGSVSSTSRSLKHLACGL